MANKGLKEYTKQISQTIGDVAKVSVNVNKEDANLHILIPLFETLGPNPINLSLIYNYQDRDRIGHFGKGCNINTYRDFSDNENYISVKEADGSYLSYWDEKGFDDFTSDENNITIVKNTILVSGDSDEYTYTFKDLQGNRICYDNGNTYYPTSINYVNGEKTTFNGINMDNGRGAKVNFTESNRVMSKTTYTQNGTTLYYVDFGYDSSQRLISVKHFKESKLVKHLSISYGSNDIIVKDEISKDYAKYTFTNNYVTKIEEVSNGNSASIIQTTISYEDIKTTLTDNDGRKVYCYFDNKNFPLFEIDEDGNAIETEYDATTKKLTAQSSAIPTKKKLANLSSINISNFTKDRGISTSAVTVSDPVLSGVLGTVYKVSGTGRLTYTLSTNGLGSDTITAVIWGKQLSAYSNSSKVKVTLTVDGQDIDEFKKTVIDNNFDMMTLGVTALKGYSKITLTIILTGNAAIEIGGIQLLKKDFGAFYQYDENGNPTESQSGKGSVSSVYNSKGLQTRSLGKESALYDFEYDDKGNMKSAKTAFGGKMENTYDSFNNLTKNVVSNASGTKKLETTKTYDSNGRFLTRETDEFGNTTNYTYDSFGKIKKITDALNATTEYSYDAFDNLTKILFNSSISVSYSYDSQNNLKTATLPNGTLYSFGYDASNNLNSVSMNDTLIVSFTYDQKTGLITNQKYGSSGDSFDFIYNSKHNISQIKINGSLKYQYIYDDFDQLIQVKNGGNTILKSFTYDNDGQMTKVVENGSTIEYGYNNLGEVNQKKRTLNSKTIYESFDSVFRSKGFHPEAIQGFLQNDTGYVGCLFDKDTTLKNEKYEIKAVTYNGGSVNKNCAKDGFIPCVNVSSTNTMSYALPMNNGYPLDSGCVAFWFKPTNYGTKYLFSVKAKNGYDFIGVYMNSNGQLILEVIDYKNIKYTLITTTGKIKLHDWNFFGLSFMNRDDGYGYPDVCEYALFLNAEVKKYNKSEPRLYVEPNSGNYHIGYKYDGSSASYGLNANITSLIIGCKSYMRIGDMQDFYRYTKDYIFGLTYLHKDAVDFSNTVHYDISDTMQNQFEIYPLHNHVKSLKGVSPIAFDLRSVTSLDKDRTFNYNNQIGRYAYVADGGKLEYDTNMCSTGTILMRVFFKDDCEKQYIFQCKDSSNRTIGLFRNESKNLEIEVNGGTEGTSLKVNSNGWHTIGFSFNEDMISNSLGGTNKAISIRVYLDGKTYSTTREISSSFGNLILSVGRQFNFNETMGNLGYLSTCYPMLGQIEMLATRAAYCELSTLNTLAGELKSTTKVSQYDELGMLNRTSIHNTDETILSTEIKYKNKLIYNNGMLSEPIYTRISHDDQLIEIPAGGRFTFEAYETYAAYDQCVSQDIDPEFILGNVSWDGDDQALDAYDSEQMTQYEHIDQAFMYTKNYEFYNNTNYSIYILFLNENLRNHKDLLTVSPIPYQEIMVSEYDDICTRTYKSDKLGNITSITDTTFGSHSYSYDQRGFLKREDSTSYEYDDNGNITKAGDTTFAYDSIIKDRLKAVNGEEITYGTNPLNPKLYRGHLYTFEGRRLTMFTYGGGSYSFEYNDQGLRTAKKNDNGIGSKYYYDGDKLITEIAPNYRLDFLYDENNQLYGFIYNNTDKYYYVRDFMQNILGIVDNAGSLVVKYGYTAYGKITSITGSLATTIGAYNPFRYKGYYYDTETEMYYCKSRYYVPEWCRWLNGDHVGYLELEELDGINLFSYCGNNPVILVDEEGEFAISIGAAIVCGLVALFAMAAATMTKPEISSSLASDIESGLKSFGDFIVESVTETFVIASLPYMLTFAALDNVLMSKKKGNLKDTGASSEVPSEKDLRDAYQDARNRGNQEEAQRIKLQQKLLGYRNKQKRNGKKPKGKKSRNFILAVLIHEIIRRF